MLAHPHPRPLPTPPAYQTRWREQRRACLVTNTLTSKCSSAPHRSALVIIAQCPSQGTGGSGAWSTVERILLSYILTLARCLACVCVFSSVHRKTHRMPLERMRGVLIAAMILGVVVSSLSAQGLWPTICKDRAPSKNIRGFRKCDDHAHADLECSQGYLEFVKGSWKISMPVAYGRNIGEFHTTVRNPLAPSPGGIVGFPV